MNSETKEMLSRQFELACRSDAAVLITGPTGVGKSHLAKKIHDKSRRKQRPFIAVNLATLHEGTFESELFGHEKGAFTGADQRRIGRFEAAHGGTVFLDEVGELPLRLQSRLLEVLQSKQISPVGSNRMIQLDMRVIAATNKTLLHEVKNKSFREDLFHRLRVISLDVPAIRERPDEFDEIVHKSLTEFALINGRTILGISEEVASILESYEWPGNIRELRNVLEYAVISTEGNSISARDLPPWLFQNMRRNRAASVQQKFPASLGILEHPLYLDYEGVMASFESEFLGRALRWNQGRVNETARRLSMSKATLIRRMRKFGLHPSEKSRPYGLADLGSVELSPDPGQAAEVTEEEVVRK